MFDKEELGIVGSLFASPLAQARAEQMQAYQTFGGAAGAGNPFAGLSGLTGMFATGAAQGLRGALGVQTPEERFLSLRQQAQQQFDTNTPEGLMQMAQFLNQQGDAQGARQAVMLAQGQQQRTATTTLRQAQTIKALQGGEKQTAEGLLASGRYTPASVAKYQQTGNIADLVLTKEATGAGDGIGKLTPAQRAADTAFGKEYNDFVAGGGIATIEKNLADLDRAIKVLEESKDGDITGKLIGLSDKAGTLSFTNPKAAEVKDIVGGVVQSNLRAVLGGQFAQKEGEALLARAFNPAQPQKDNLNRLKALRQQIANSAQSKIQAVTEFEEKGTLKDFKPGAFKQSASAITSPQTATTTKEVDFSNLPKRK